MMPTVLSVNLNKIALLRNSREGNSPNVLHFAQLAVEQGALGITVHPRPDQRHIRPRDVYELNEWVKQRPEIEFNIEGNPFAGANTQGYPGFLSLVEATRPHQATLVPDTDEQLTSDHGFDLLQDNQALADMITQLKQWGVRVSLFMDPDIAQIDKAKQLGADRIELYTGPYAAAFTTHEKTEQLLAYQQAAVHANSIGLSVNAGHDLNLENLPELLSCAQIAEVSIGHALTIDALYRGYEDAVAAYSKICNIDYNSKKNNNG